MTRSLATNELLHAIACVALFFSPKLARAQSSPPHREHVRFSYRAPAGCPNESDFTDLVRARDAAIIADDEAARSVSVAIALDEKWSASLQTESIANGKARRTIIGDSCESVAKSIAIFTAIALREGSPDELPPAHPELAQKESLEAPEEGFMPMARPQKPGADVIDLYRGRFALTASESLTLINDSGRSLSTNFGAAYFSSNFFGVGIEGGVHANFPGDRDGDLAIAHALGYFEFVFMRAKAAVLAPDHGRTLDLFMRFGGGAMWARPQHAFYQPDHPYSPGFYFQPSLGMRLLVSNDIAVLFQTHIDSYQQENLDQSFTAAVGGGFQLGITWFPSKANRWSP